MTRARPAVTTIGHDDLRAALQEHGSQPSAQNVLITDWTGFVDEAGLDPPLAPQWTWISALSGGFTDRLHALSTRDAMGRPGFAAFLEYKVRHFGIPLTLRELPGCNLLCYHPAIVAAQAPEQVIDSVLGFDGRDCQVLYVPEVVVGSELDTLIRELASSRSWFVDRVPSHRSPYVPVTGTWEQNLAGRSSNFRYNLKRKHRALEAFGKVTERWFTDEASVPELLRQMHAIEESSWKVGAEMAISRSQRETSYYEMLLPWLARRGALQANVLYVADQPSAYSLCYVSQGRMAQMKTSFSEAHASASPGITVVANAIRRTHELGLTEFDFLGDMMPHKAQWTSLTRDHDHLYVYTNSLSARVVALLKRLARRIRPPATLTTVGRSGRKGADDAP